MNKGLSLKKLIECLKETLPLVTKDVTGYVRDQCRNYVVGGVLHNIETNTVKILVYPQKYTDVETTPECNVRNLLWKLERIEIETKDGEAPEVICICTDEKWNPSEFNDAEGRDEDRRIAGAFIRDGELCLGLIKNAWEKIPKNVTHAQLNALLEKYAMKSDTMVFVTDGTTLGAIFSIVRNETYADKNTEIRVCRADGEKSSTVSDIISKLHTIGKSHPESQIKVITTHAEYILTGIEVKEDGSLYLHMDMETYTF